MAWLQSKVEQVMIGSKVVAWHLKAEQDKQQVFLLLSVWPD